MGDGAHFFSLSNAGPVSIKISAEEKRTLKRPVSLLPLYFQLNFFTLDVCRLPTMPPRDNNGPEIYIRVQFFFFRPLGFVFAHLFFYRGAGGCPGLVINQPKREEHV